MAIVKIPTTSNPFRVIVNGVEYVYEAGTTVDVPDAVATVIQQHDSAKDRLTDTEPDMEDRVLDMLIELGMLAAVTAGDGRVLADENENVILRY